MTRIPMIPRVRSYDDELEDFVCEEHKRICVEDEYLGPSMDFYKQNGNVVIVDASGSIMLFKLTPLAMECFRRTFPGKICNFDQWKYFANRLRVTMNKTGVGRDKLNVVKLGVFSLY